MSNIADDTIDTAAGYFSGSFDFYGEEYLHSGHIRYLVTNLPASRLRKEAKLLRFYKGDYTAMALDILQSNKYLSRKQLWIIAAYIVKSPGFDPEKF